jgi:CrcB protein
MNLLLIAIGGALGSVARYLSCEVIIFYFSRAQNFPQSFPWGTFFVNVFGSMLAGILYYFVIKNFDNFDPPMGKIFKNFLFAGFLGGFTTFSAFSLDFFRLTTAGQYSQAIAYAVASVTLSILALFFGFYSMKLIFS